MGEAGTMPERGDARLKAFKSQLRMSKRCGLPFVFTFEQWLAWWEIDARLERCAGHAVVTPDGRFDNIALAARHHGLSQTDAWLLARDSHCGWRWDAPVALLLNR
jgi:hypothetical protein